MGTLSVSNSLSLRNFYRGNTVYLVNTTRNNSTSGQLSFADSTALRRAVKQLGEFDFSTATKEDIQQRLNAFAETYNNTLSSGAKYSSKNPEVMSAVKKIKGLSEEKLSELKKCGITIDSKGRMSVSDTAAENIKGERFNNLFDGKGDYMKQLSAYAKKITAKVDIYL